MTKYYFSMGKYGFSVFVGNLSRRVRRDDLKDTFRDMGRIIEVDIKTGYGKLSTIDQFQTLSVPKDSDPTVKKSL